MYQNLVFIGNLGGDPDMHTTPAGKEVANFSVACNRYWNDDKGERQEETTWFRVSAWGRLGQLCKQYLTKGRLVLVEGRLVVEKDTGGPRIWQTEKGESRASFEVFALEVKFLGPSGNNGAGEPAAAEGEIPF